MIPHRQIWECLEQILNAYEIRTVNLKKRPDWETMDSAFLKELEQEVKDYFVWIVEPLNHLLLLMVDHPRVGFQYRLKDTASMIDKIHRKKDDPAISWGAILNDILGLRFIFPCKEEELHEKIMEFIRWAPEGIKVDRSDQTKEDGYRGQHVYARLGRRRFPIEIQFWTRKDALINWYLRDTIYKELDDHQDVLEYAQELRAWMDAVPQPNMSIQTYVDYLYEKVAFLMLNNEK